jgi:hypothetical protein
MEEYQQTLDTLCKKVDKLLNLTTKIAKTLHLVPVTEKEEKAIQVMRERNAQQAFKVAEERADFKNEQEDIFAPSMELFQQLSIEDVYSDVLADDVIPHGKE